jgi:EAL domain-containing protein (putative c-di-GMP-specific phosphodiesterase class I)
LLPRDFIPLAEETGLITQISGWVIEQACQHARLWQTRRPGGTPYGVAVNLSTRQFLDGGLQREIETALREAGLAGDALTLELTESTLLQETDAALAQLEGLRRLGVRLAIDDFGTGYSSLSYLTRFHTDVLKIDPSFVDGVGIDPESTAIVQSIVALASTLGLVTVAEGIESSAQLTTLQALGVEQGQGFLLASPMTAEAFGKLVDAAPPLHAIPRPQQAA